MHIFQTIVTALTFLGTLCAATLVFAADEFNVSTGTTVEGYGVAVRGNDPVALATKLDVTPGHAEHSHAVDGVAYYFASASSMKRFAANPDMYLPQFGGFCALGVALGKKLDGSPRFADIVDGKLYVFLNAAVLEKYKEDKAGIIATAHENWPAMHHVSVEEVNGL